MIEEIIANESFKFSSSWLNKLFNKLIEVKKNRNQEFDKINDIFDDPLVLSKSYVEPDCQQFNPADDDEQEISYVVREPVFRRIESFLGGNKRTGKHQLFVLSDAGMGKTSLLVMLKLGHITSFWPKGYECSLFKLEKNTLSELKEIKNKRNTVLLLDALDEDPLAWKGIQNRMIDILRETENFRRVIITCRTQFFSGGEDPFNRRGQVEIGGYLCPVIYNSLFTKAQVEQFLKKKFSGFKLRKAIQRSNEIISNMGSLKFRPMLLAHIEDFLEAEHIIWNGYTIYHTLVSVWLLREKRKITDTDKSKINIAGLWSACRKLAVFLQQKGSREVTKEEIESLITQYPEIKNIPYMDIGGRSLLNKNSKGDYRFSHYSVQEFLIVNSAVEGTENLSKGSIKLTDLINQFYVDWLRNASENDHVIKTRQIFELTKANLSNTDLKGFNFSGMSLNEANLDNTKMNHSNCMVTNLVNASLENSDLSFANFSNSDLRGANLKSANITGTIFTNAKYDESTIFPDSFDKK